jgi:predicted phosphodiesterase
VEEKDGILYLNPGSAGPRRYGRPRTMAFLKIQRESAAVRVFADIVVVED